MLLFRAIFGFSLCGEKLFSLFQECPKKNKKPYPE
jgi:hypothetical protein